MGSGHDPANPLWPHPRACGKPPVGQRCRAGAPDGDAQRTAVRELEDQAIRVLLDLEEETDEGALEAARESLNERRLFSVLLRRAAETLPTRPAPGAMRDG
jgi:hypothetical protein